MYLCYVESKCSICFSTFFEPDTSVFVFSILYLVVCSCLSISPWSVLHFLSSLTTVKVVVLETYLWTKHIKDQIDLLWPTDQSLPSIDKNSANQWLASLLLFGLDAFNHKRYDPMYFYVVFVRGKPLFDIFFLYLCAWYKHYFRFYRIFGSLCASAYKLFDLFSIFIVFILYECGCLSRLSKMVRWFLSRPYFWIDLLSNVNLKLAVLF